MSENINNRYCASQILGYFLITDAHQSTTEIKSTTHIDNFGHCACNITIRPRNDLTPSNSDQDYVNAIYTKFTFKDSQGRLMLDLISVAVSDNRRATTGARINVHHHPVLGPNPILPSINNNYSLENPPSASIVNELYKMKIPFLLN